jgi:hypothetical protein
MMNRRVVTFWALLAKRARKERVTYEILSERGITAHLITAIGTVSGFREIDQEFLFAKYCVIL